MRKMQPGIQQQRFGDESPGERLPHRVFPVLGVQQAAAAGGRVLSAGGRVAVPGRPQPAAGEELRRKPPQPRTHPLQQTAAPDGYIVYLHLLHLFYNCNTCPQSNCLSIYFF